MSSALVVETSVLVTDLNVKEKCAEVVQGKSSLKEAYWHKTRESDWLLKSTYHLAFANNKNYCFVIFQKIMQLSFGVRE